ncbi:sugar phosphate isomerase [Plantactinospora sp. BC1]|uniref:sugar phosphate isomerase/epimerase family protein n=1 Tax=Plantactinospora sp. BC1 TaxID=2108470 RepID=UPI000D1755BF|nr:sugar phosphate isomerase/epimerase [Plantactinospora sp. BC1]AVT29591.1 sugar phosphate isomerase [Plantactinospora sp. BC1]
MRLGLLTACLPGEPLDAIAGWAAGHGYRGLEVAAWPREPDRPWQASHLDVDGFDAGAAERVRALLDGHGLTVSAVAYYENNLHADPAVRERIHRHLRRCVDAAALLGCEHVGTFVGRDVTRTVTENLRLGEEVLPPLVAYAADRGVRLVVENCPMEGWHPDGYPANLAYSPELWDWLGGLGLFLNYDPSHLVWLGIDPVAALTGHLDLVRHVQAKDVQVDPAARNRFGVFGQLVGKPSPWASGWWRYRVPGLGEVDWRRLVDVLYEGGYSGFVSVEHEDPVWSGSPDRVRQGLVIAERTLNPLLVA